MSRILILATHGFEHSELVVPRDRLSAAGHDIVIASPEQGSIRGWKGKDWAGSVDVDTSLDDVDAGQFDAIVLPGGQINPDLLRVEPKAIALIKAFHDAGKPVAAVCHAPWLLIEAGLVKGLKSTSYGSIKTDMVNAGANWIDRSVVVDRNIITSRNPDDLADFSDAIVAALETVPA